METLEKQIENLIKQHGAEAFVKAVKAHKTEAVKKPLGDPPSCQKGYYWNGSRCVLDVG